MLCCFFQLFGSLSCLLLLAKFTFVVYVLTFALAVCNVIQDVSFWCHVPNRVAVWIIAVFLVFCVTLCFWLLSYMVLFVVAIWSDAVCCYLHYCCHRCCCFIWCYVYCYICELTPTSFVDYIFVVVVFYLLLQLCGVFFVSIYYICYCCWIMVMFIVDV